MNMVSGQQPGYTKTNKKTIELNSHTILGALLLVTIVLVSVSIYLQFKPPFLAEQRGNQEIQERVKELAEVPEFEKPTVALIANSDNLRSDSPINAEVYKDAEDGDYVLGYSDKIVIYRKDGDRVIYDGPSPVAQLEQNIVANIRNSANVLGLQLEENEQVQISVVTDDAALKDSNPEFYANAEPGDIIATFPQSQYILIYRPSSGNIVNNGQLDISIN